jgi:hypothetical protein
MGALDDLTQRRENQFRKEGSASFPVVFPATAISVSLAAPTKSPLVARTQ